MTNNLAIIPAHLFEEMASELSRPLHSALITVHGWLKNHVAKPDAALGRRGDVCPFVRPSLEKYKGTYYAPFPDNPDFDSLVRFMRELHHLYDELAPTEPQRREFKTVLALFPFMTPENAPSLPSLPSLIDAVQVFLKPEVVATGLMIGQFYPTCAEPGLHNPQYRPLQSPVPLLVLRPMQLMDLGFLTGNPAYVKAYCSKFKLHSRSQLEERVRQSGLEQLPLNWEANLLSVFGSDAALKTPANALISPTVDAVKKCPIARILSKFASFASFGSRRNHS